MASTKIRPISNYEGFKRLDKSLEKIELREAAKSKICDVCQRRCRAWRLVPATFGHKIGVTRSLAFARGRFVIACDAGPDGCAAALVRAGVDREAVEQQARIDRIGLVLA